jgi:hypothetical protein
LIDRDPLVWDEFRADHLHRDLRDFYLVHLAEKMNHHAPVDLHDVDLNSVLKVLMKVYPNQDVQGGQKSQQNQDATMVDQKMVVRLMIHLMIHLMMDVRKMIHLMKDGRLMDDQNYLVDLNFRDALPYAYSLISIEI